MAELAAPGDRGRLSAYLLVAGLVVAAVALALTPAVRRGLLRVVSGDPLTVGWRLERDPPALVLELRSVRAAAPVELEALLVERRLARRLEPEAPAELVDAGSSMPAGFSAKDWVAWVGSVPLEPGGTTRLVIPCARTRAGVGRLVVVYRYRSVLSPMSSSAFVDVDVTWPGTPGAAAGAGAPGAPSHRDERSR